MNELLQMRVAFLLLLLATGPVLADVPHFEFVERLRQQELADVAVEYLEQLAKSAPPKLAGRFCLERAKTLLALMEQSPAERQFDARLSEAIAECRQHAKAAREPATEAEWKLDIGQLLLRQGRQRVNRARQLEAKSERQDALVHARASFAQADAEFQASRAAWDRALAAGGSSDRSHLAARSDETALAQATLMLQSALLMHRADQFEQRIQQLRTARHQLMQLAERDAVDPLGWQAYLEAGRCLMELDRTNEALIAFAAIGKAAGRAPAATVQAARYLELLVADRIARYGATDIVRGCEEWLARYSAAARTADGCGVQFLLASCLARQAQSGVTPGKDGGPASVSDAARWAMEKAERHLKRLAAHDNEYSRRASHLRSELLATLMAERAAAGIGRLRSFDECLISAQIDCFHLSKLAGVDQAAKRKHHLHRAIQALERGQQLVTPGDDPKDVFTSRLMLSYLYLSADNPYSAAVLGEHLSRSSAPAPRGAKAAAYALTALAVIVRESRARHVAPEELAEDIRRLRELAEYVERTWPDEPDTDAARYQLGNLFFDDQHYSEAFQMLSRIGDAFPGLAFARYRMGAAAQLAGSRDASLTAEAKQQMVKRAIADLERLPDPAPGSSSETVLSTYQARMQLGHLLLLAGESADFDRVERLGADMLVKLKNYADTVESDLPQLEAECDRMRLAGLWGKAHRAIQRGQVAEAKRILDQPVRMIAASATAWMKSTHLAEPWYQGFLQAQRSILLLDARANILAGTTDRLDGCLQAFDQLALPEQHQLNYEQLLKLVLDLKKDLDGFKATNDTQRQKRLQAGLVDLLDQLTRQKNMSVDVRIYLAQGYSAIDAHDRAAALLDGVTATAADDEAATRSYRLARLTLAREYRLARDFVKAKAVLRDILGTQQNKGWGFDNLDVRKESIALLEDEGQHAGAAQMAAQMQSRLINSVREYEAKQQQVRQARQPDANGSAQPAEAIHMLEQDLQRLTPLRERYYEFHLLEIRAIVAHAEKSNDAKSRDTIARMAARLVRLEQSQPDCGGVANRATLVELIAQHESLRQAYIAAGGTTMPTKP